MIDYGVSPSNFESVGKSSNDQLLNAILNEQKKTNSLLENLVSIFVKYDKDYNEELIRDVGRSDLLS